MTFFEVFCSLLSNRQKQEFLRDVVVKRQDQNGRMAGLTEEKK